jgi:hypothetical protein
VRHFRAWYLLFDERQTFSVFHRLNGNSFKITNIELITNEPEYEFTTSKAFFDSRFAFGDVGFHQCDLTTSKAG